MDSVGFPPVLSYAVRENMGIRVAFAVLIALLAPAVHGQFSFLEPIELEDCLLTDARAYMVLPPRPAGSGQTTWMQWSGSGRYLLMLEMGPRITPADVDRAARGGAPSQMRLDLLSWDRETGRSVSCGRLPEGFLPSNLQFFAGTDLGVGSYSEEVPAPSGRGPATNRTVLVFLDAASGRLTRTPLSMFPKDEMPVAHLVASPKAPRVLVVQYAVPPYVKDDPSPRLMQTAVSSLDPQGKLTPSIDLGGRFAKVVWHREGEIAEVFYYRHGTGSPPVQESFGFDMRTGRKLSEFERSPVAAAAPPFQLVGKSATSGTRTFPSYWLKSVAPSEVPEALVAARADQISLSPTSDAVAILDKGVVTVRLLAPFAKEAFLQAKAMADRMKAMSYGKQVAVGLLMFAADNGDRLPSAAEYGDGAIGKYLKDKGLGGGFVYMMSGGFMSDIRNPAEAVMGYVPGPGGYAWVHADGHVVWKTDPPKPPLAKAA